MTHSLRHLARIRDAVPPGRAPSGRRPVARAPGVGAVVTGFRDRPSGSAVSPEPSRPRFQGRRSSPALPPWTRHRGLLVALMAVVVAGGVPLALQRSLDRSPLSTDGGPSSFPGERVDRRSATGEEVRVAHVDGGPYEFTFTVTNYSRWPVQILGFPSSDSVLRPPSVAIDWTPLADDDSRPFQPFTLGAEDSVLVRMRTEFTHCDRYPTGGAVRVYGVPVRYRVLWLTRTRSLDLPTALDVPAPLRGGCPV
jgi:hypothetical protein